MAGNEVPNYAGIGLLAKVEALVGGGGVDVVDVAGALAHARLVAVEADLAGSQARHHQAGEGRSEDAFGHLFSFFGCFFFQQVVAAWSTAEALFACERRTRPSTEEAFDSAHKIYTPSAITC